MAKYVENENFTPNPTDATGTVTTTRTGVPMNLDVAGAVFVQDRVETAKAVVDGDATIHHREGVEDREGVENAIKEKAQEFVDEFGDFQPGDKTPAEKEAAQEGEHDAKATSQDKQPDITDATQQNKTTQDLTAPKAGAAKRTPAKEKAGDDK